MYHTPLKQIEKEKNEKFVEERNKDKAVYKVGSGGSNTN